MPRLCDRMQVEPIYPAPWENTYDRTTGENYWPGHVRDLRVTLADVPIIVADEVAEFFYAGTDQEHWKATDDFPVQAPPFPVWWVETRHPSKIVSSDYGVLHWSTSTPKQWGTLFYVVPNELAAHVVPPSWRGVEARWWIGMQTYIDDPLLYPVMPTSHGVVEISRSFMPVGEDGMAMDDPRSFAVNVIPEREQLAEDLVGRTGSMANPHAMAVSLMHAKNVPMRDVRPPVKVDKKWRKRHDAGPLRTYKVIDLEPFKQVMDRGEGGSRAPGAAKTALHLCRGHLKTYTEDAPLFGKHVGTYFWASHVRGTADAGVSDHDYEVHK